VSGRGRDDDARTVYSSGPGFSTSRKQDREERDERAQPPRPAHGKGGAARKDPAFPNDGIARVRRETAHRGGKTVTAIYGLRLADAALRELGSELKRMCGTGGSAKDGVIEIQGEHVDRVIEALLERGFQAKRGGG